MSEPIAPATLGLDKSALRKLLVGFGIALIIFFLPTPDGLSLAGKHTLMLFVFIVYLWATEALPLPVTALMAGAGLVLLRVVDRPNEAWTPYAQDTIFFLLGSLILADAITKTGADKVLAARFLRRFGGSTDTLLFGIVAVSALSAMLISNHAVAAVMLPLVVSILRATGLIKNVRYAAAYILAIALGAGIAGLGTPSGGSRNVIIIGYLDELYDIHISYLEWTIRAAPITLALIPITFFILKWAFKVGHEKLSVDELPLSESKLTHPQKVTLIIMGFTVALWIAVGKDLGLGTIAIIGAISMFMVGILDWVDTRKRIAWGVPLIYGAALTLGQQLAVTGAAGWLASVIEGPLSSGGEALLLIGVLLLATILTNIMSDGGTAAVLAPVALVLAVSLATGGAAITEDAYGLHVNNEILHATPGAVDFVRDVGMVTAIGAAFGFMLVVANPANVIAYSSGMFRARDLAKVGLPLTAAALVLSWVAIKFYWPMLG